MGKIDWKWMIIGVAVGYAGSVYLPKYLNK